MSLAVDWGWILDHADAIAYRSLQHLYLAAIAVAIGFLISFALAVWSVRRRAVYAPITAIAGILYTIPALALFAALIPITGIELSTAEIPLILYTFVILIRNIVAGFDAVPPEVREAAAGMGYGTWQRLWRVELPLAIPLIIAGLRLASVSTIGLVTISATIGNRFGGLGYFILDGYRLGFATEMYVGALPSVLLAVLADVAFVQLGRWLTPWTRAASAQTGPVPA